MHPRAVLVVSNHLAVATGSTANQLKGRVYVTLLYFSQKVLRVVDIVRTTHSETAPTQKIHKKNTNRNGKAS